MRRRWGTLLVDCRGWRAMNLYSGPRKGRSSSSAPATNMILPRTSPYGQTRKLQSHAPISRTTRPSAVRCPAVGVRWRSSNPTQTTVSPPLVLCHDSGTPTVEQSTKNVNKARRYCAPCVPGGSHPPLPCATCRHCSLQSTASIYRSHRRLWTSSMTQRICQMSPRC